MKRLLILPALLLLLLSSCKDEEVKPDDNTPPGEETVVEEPVTDEEPGDEEEPVADEDKGLAAKLQGEWSNFFRTTEYYNDAGEVAHKDTATVDVRFEFEENNMYISNPGVVGEEHFNYALPDTSETKYIVLSKDGTQADYFKITESGDSLMVWEKVIEYAGYKDAEGNTITSRRGVYSYEFKKL